jgi:asparagine synthase (glutamine-hydrolysing)
MCGICGIIQFNGHGADNIALRAMNDRIVHRGPDDEGYHIEGSVGLAMRRLSIIDLATGHQPISNEDQTIWIVFNGEIYNHAELRRSLEGKGHQYRTNSDTETIVHLYEEYGDDAVKHLRGMFAFAILDRNRKRVLLARDRLGIKPLYYRHSRESLVFGSEVKALLAYPGVDASLNRGALPEYLAFGFIHGEETLFGGIRKLQPGHVMEVSLGGEITIRQYWDVPLARDEGRQSDESYVRQYRELLDDAVSSHLMSDVPLGMFLSGGLDSSAIAAIMARGRKDRIKTFSVGYEESAFSELSYASEVAKHIGTDHREVRVSRNQFFDALPKLIWHEDEPLMGTASIPLYFVSELARQNVKVVLTGEGSDETLGGYSRYPWTLFNLKAGRIYKNLAPRKVREFVRNSVATGSRGSARVRNKLSHTFIGCDVDDWNAIYFDNFFSAFSEPMQTELLQQHTAAEGAAYSAASTLTGQDGRGPLDRLLYMDMKGYLVELLMKQDTMSMAASVESRVPFLDHPLVEFAASLPARVKVRGFEGKWILKQAVADLLPKSIIYRKKMGFPTPFEVWARGPELNRISKLLLDERTTARGIFKKSAVEALLLEHRSGTKIHTNRLWRLLNLELWQRIFVDGDQKPMELRERYWAVGTPNPAS